MNSGSSEGSFEQDLATLRQFVVIARTDELMDRHLFYCESLEELRVIIRKLDSSANLKELSSDLLDEQRWLILVGVCEVELKRRGFPVGRFEV